ncbi:hypothetical protein I4F81_004341 [Pyropia yezoensis]|uniref:Uncharacterized protein n=1 Tax=Pyropia yezoensis TaxID=2788 RepID=A0ACC3BVQ0_PYRYE|nr:hypothetical protein I4F81_004341 [Neopyropia yezoensis]
MASAGGAPPPLPPPGVGGGAAAVGGGGDGVPGATGAAVRPGGGAGGVPPPPGTAPTGPVAPVPPAAGPWVVPPSAAAQAAMPLPRVPGGAGGGAGGDGGGIGGAIPDDSPLAALLAARRRLDAAHRRALDALAPRTLERWVGLCVGLLLFTLRIVLVQGYYIVAYMLAIFLLNQLLLFLQPKDRASLLAANEEFRPFVRRLPEFTFWHGASVATVLALCATAFPIFDVPVFWPVLVVYFLMLFAVTMRRQWQDMKKLRYVPWDIGQKRRRPAWQGGRR